MHHKMTHYQEQALCFTSIVCVCVCVLYCIVLYCFYINGVGPTITSYIPCCKSMGWVISSSKACQRVVSALSLLPHKHILHYIDWVAHFWILVYTLHCTLHPYLPASPSSQKIGGSLLLWLCWWLGGVF